MHTLDQYQSGEVGIGNTDCHFDFDRRYRVIYTENGEGWHFLSTPFIYQPINFASDKKARDFVEVCIPNNFIPDAIAYAIVKNVQCTYRLHGKYPIAIDK